VSNSVGPNTHGGQSRLGLLQRHPLRNGLLHPVSAALPPPSASQRHGEPLRVLVLVTEGLYIIFDLCVTLILVDLETPYSA
jgi:hypothetical protein